MGHNISTGTHTPNNAAEPHNPKPPNSHGLTGSHWNFLSIREPCKGTGVDVHCAPLRLWHDMGVSQNRGRSNSTLNLLLEGPQTNKLPLILGNSHMFYGFLLEVELWHMEAFPAC